MRKKYKYNYKSNSKDVLLIKTKGGRLGRLLFNSAYLIVVSLLLQIVLLILLVVNSKQYFPFIFSGYMLFAVLLVIVVINREGNPLMKLTWAVLILTLPVFGALLYLYVDTQIGNRLMNRRLTVLKEHSKAYVHDDSKVRLALNVRNEGSLGICNYLKHIGDFSVYSNTSAEYYPSGEAYFDSLLKKLRQAKRFIFIESFIIKEGYMWGRILKILADKANEGVEVRVMYDGLCAVSSLPYSYPKKMKQLGIKCKMFAPIYPILSTHYNNRDHRKIIVIDNEYAFTGGINLADEYINLYQPYGKWKDCGILLHGDAVKSFTLMFLNIWNANEKLENFDSYLNVISKNSEPSLENGFFVPYSDNPVDKDNVGKCVYLDMINRARKYIYFMTPYLIIDNELMTALKFAAKRGVDVRIILPHIPDKKYAFALAKSHYTELINAGVGVYEYLPGFIHAKVAVSDDTEGVVGSINLDFRSLYLHYECAVYVVSSDVIKKILDDFSHTFEKCKRIALSDVKSDSLLLKLAGKLLKLFSPLL